MSTPQPQTPDPGDSSPAVMDEGAAAEALAELLISSVLASRSAVASLQASEAVAMSALVQVARRQADLSGKRWASERDIPLRSIAADLASELRVSDTTVQRNLGDAYAITTLFPATREAWERGEITRSHVNQILTVGSPILNPVRRAEFETAILPIAKETSASRTGAAARRIVERYMDDSLQVRHDVAVARREVRVRDVEDGMAELTATIDAVIAHGIYDRLTKQAHLLRDEGSPTAPPVVDAVDAAVNDTTGTADDAVDATTPAMNAASGRVNSMVVGNAGADGAGQTWVGSDGVREHAQFVCNTRSMDALRADILTDLLLTGGPSNIADFNNVATSTLAEIHGIVQVTIPVLTLRGHEQDTEPGDATNHTPDRTPGDVPVTGPGDASTGEPDPVPGAPPQIQLGEEPGFLNGRCPIDPDTARRLAGAAPGLDRVMFHPVTGAVLAVDRYRPSSELKKFLTARDEHCRFPGCRTPAHRCDIDHTIDAAYGGKTRAGNLAHLCRRHHTLKHASRWTVTHLPGGILRWTSPSRRIHTDRPPSNVRFTPTADPDPPPF